MPRTTAELVGGVIEVDDDDDLVPQIETANNIVTAHCTESDYSDETLELIERWLSAHFYAIDRRRVVQEGIATGPNQTFDKFEVDMMFFNTTYGQTACSLDPDGNLAALSNSLQDVKATIPGGGRRVTWLGTART